MLDSAAYLRGQSGGFEGVLQLDANLIQIALTRLASGGDQVGDSAVLLRFEVLERQVFELGADLPDAEAGGERRVDLHRLAGDSRLLLGPHHVERAHVVQTVGQFDDHDAHVVGHGDEHLAQVLGLGFAVDCAGHARQLQRRQFGRAVDQLGHVDAELGHQLRAGDAAILHHIVQQCGLQSGHVELQLRAGHRGRQRMLDVWMPGASQMAFVLGLCVLVGGQHLIAVGGREILLQHVDEHIERWMLLQIDDFCGDRLGRHGSIIQSRAQSDFVIPALPRVSRRD